jgi:PTH2 family peptidyl-tRNA hydrolase
MKIFKRIAAKLVNMEDYQYKQVILMRQDLKLPKGKMAAQAAHASVEAVLKSDKNKVSGWRNNGSKKVVLKVENEKELYRYIQLAKDADITTSAITDAGKTVIASGTVTCGAIGPDFDEKIDRITGKLGMV